MTDEGGCGTCAHWEQPRKVSARAVEAYPDYTRTNYEDPVPGWVTAEYEKGEQADALFGECQGVGMGPADASKPLPLAVVLDAEEYMAVMFTRAEFSCALWSRREEGRP